MTTKKFIIELLISLFFVSLIIIVLDYDTFITRFELKQSKTLYEDAIQNADVNLCYQISSRDARLRDSKSRCIFYVAIESSNLELCKSDLIDESQQSQCTLEIALKEKDLSLCNLEIIYPPHRADCIDAISKGEIRD